MKRLCLPKSERDNIADALKSGKLTIRDLYGLKSAERKKLLTKYVGEDFATLVNAKFEQAMMSKQKNAIVRWIKDVTEPKTPIRRDMLKKVKRIEGVLSTAEQDDFLADLAESKLGIGVTDEEAKTIIALKNDIDNLRANISDNSPVGSQERMAYGLALDRFKQYIGTLKLQAENLSLKERFDLKNFGNNLVDFAGTAKSLVATLDNSFIGRQGIKTLLRGDYKLWGKTLVDSFKLFGKELVAKAPPKLFADRDDAVMAAVRADVFSRPNALNGKYTAAKNGYGLGLMHEEAFPSSLPSKVPLLGRVFKASETAFNGSAIKMRAALADAIIANAEKNGVDVLDEKQATALGNLVTSLTGRGELDTFAAAGKQINALMFAPRFLKANFNTLTAHMFDKRMTPYARRVAAESTLKIAASTATLLSIASMLGFDVEWDPRSTNFGKITIGNHRYDITGGMSGLVTLGSRVTPTFHNGEWGFWTKSGSTDNYTKMSVGNYGEQTALDTFEAFFEGKLSPAAGIVRDVWKGQKYGGEKPDIVNTITGLTVPISAQILEQELKKGNDDLLFAMIAEGLGFSASDVNFGGYGEKWRKFEEKYGATKMNQELKKVTERFNKRADQLKNSGQWDKMTNEQQREALEKIKTEETDRVLGNI